jgi:DNA replication and repair protein RecF
MGGDASSNRFLHPDDQPMVSAAIRRHFEGELDEVKLEFRVINRGGETFWVQTNCSTVVDSSGRVTDIVFTMRDISEIKALEEELKEQARTDGLTKLANRKAFDEALDREWRRTLGDCGELSLLLIDVDHFKSFNDTNGHQVGDDCLRTLAATLGSMFKRAGDLVAVRRRRVCGHSAADKPDRGGGDGRSALPCGRGDAHAASSELGLQLRHGERGIGNRDGDDRWNGRYARGIVGCRRFGSLPSQGGGQESRRGNLAAQTSDAQKSGLGLTSLKRGVCLPARSTPRIERAVHVSRLALTDFRSYGSALIEPGPGFVLLYGDNGAGKTNLLEALSLLSPGRGLRGAPLPEMARQGGEGGFSVAARLGDLDIGTGTLAGSPDRRLVRINGAPSPVNSLGEWLSVLWLTPAMDRLFSGPAGDRRRFLDRLVLALEPSHARNATRYEAAMRSRNKLLADPGGADPAWLDALEAQMAEYGGAVSQARARVVAALGDQAAAAPEDEFARAALSLEGWPDDGNWSDLAGQLREGRARDSAAGRTLAGPHRQDLGVVHRAKALPAAQSSTGEQKALLLGLVLAHADLVAGKRGAPPILLLDEVAAHLDPRRRAALFARIEGRGQVWMTATEAGLFEGISEASRFHVRPGAVDLG